MKKNNTKVELKKYLSQKEKIKNTFISSCIILVILTFVIFITYSYFMDNSGEQEVGEFNTSIPDVEIIDRHLVENTNEQQAIYTIKNNSSKNTYSYNLNLKDRSSGHYGQVYYKIPSEEYSHPEGIIKPNETKKILLVSQFRAVEHYTQCFYLVCNSVYINSPWIFKLNTGYEYSPLKIEDGYENIKYSPLSSKTELIELNTNDGILKYKNNKGNIISGFDKNQTNYDLLFSIFSHNNGSDINQKTNSVLFSSKLSNGGKITGRTVKLDKEGRINHEIKVYAEDGTYIKSYYIDNGYRMAGHINYLQVTGNRGIVYGSVTSNETNGFDPSECIDFNIDSGLIDTFWNFYITFADDNYYLNYSSDFGKYSANLVDDWANKTNIDPVNIGHTGMALEFPNFPGFGKTSILYLYIYFNPGDNQEAYEVSRYCINAIRN